MTNITTTCDLDDRPAADCIGGEIYLCEDHLDDFEGQDLDAWDYVDQITAARAES